MQASGRNGRLADARRARLRDAGAHRGRGGGGDAGRPHALSEKPLREAIAAKLARDNGVSYDADSEILVTTGATLGIHAALTALLDEGDEVLLPDPIYDAYRRRSCCAAADVRCDRRSRTAASSFARRDRGGADAARRGCCC